MRLLLIGGLCALSLNALADEYVDGYVRRDGTYVPPHYRSSPNDTRLDNYSSQGNVNPYTGHRGYERVDPPEPRPLYVPPPPSYTPQYPTRR